MDLFGPRAGFVAAALLLAACRTDGERGHAFTRESTYQPQGIEPWRLEIHRSPERTGTQAERTETAVLVALTRSILEAERAAGAMALTQVSSRRLRGHAAEAVSSAEQGLDALQTLSVARGLDVATTALGDDPVIAAQHETAQRDLARLRALSGGAFARVWLAGELSRLDLLRSLAGLGERLSTDVAAGNAFRMIAHDARTRADRATAMAAHLDRPAEPPADG